MKKCQGVPPDMAVRMRPFSALGAHFTDEFKALTRELLHLVCEYADARHKAPEPAAGKAERLSYLCTIHDGWKKAQATIASSLLVRLQQHQVVKQQVTDYHRVKQKEAEKAALAELRRLELEMRVLRRIFDTIPWAIFGGEHSTIRRLSVKGGGSNFSAQNVQEAMDAAESLNREPHVIAIAADMTTFIHVGDLLISDVKKGALGLVELKSGEKNRALTEAAAFAVQSQCPAYEAWAKSEFCDTDYAHFERAKRQYQRSVGVIRTIHDEKGVDHNTGARVTIHSSDVPLELYADSIVQCWRQLNDEKKWAISVVDECLYVGVYTDHRMGFVGFNAWMDGMKCTSPVYSLTDSFRMLQVRPLGMLPLPLELISKILTGEVCVVICLDLKAFMDLGNLMSPGTFTLASKKDSAAILGGYYVYAQLDGRAIRMNDGLLGGGSIDRIVFDLLRPATLLSMHLSTGMAKRSVDFDDGDQTVR